MSEKYKEYTISLQMTDGRKYKIPIAVPNGEDGKDGKDGYTPIKGVDYFDGKDGEPGPPGKSAFTAGEHITITDTGRISVLTADKAVKDNTRPITSAAVYTQVGNIEVLLNTI
jgi:hypothetical protein